MRIAILFLGLWTLVGFASSDLLSDLRSSKVYVLKLDFEMWRSEIDSIPNGFDDYARRHVYLNYVSSILELEAFMKEEGITFVDIIDRTSIPQDTEAFILDYRLKCTGGPEVNDWWLCDKGFFFQNIKLGLKSKYLGTVKVVKTLKKKLEKGR